jgi:pimeloyl-ACP methyl ester carboxylesterase
MEKLVIPVGFRSFHNNKFINYQINRWYSLGYTRLEDLNNAASKIKNFNDNKKEYINLADKAIKENRLKNAAFYYRAAEFLTDPSDQDKSSLYKKFYDAFYKGFSDEPIKRYKIKYGNAFIPAMKLSYTQNPKGVILIHGGFDSFIEEFFCLWKYLAEKGYEIIAFEGPGQGTALKNGLVADLAWEKPTKAVLDHFRINDATLIGISFGGYWCMRAAAFEKRIKRVIAFPPFYDLLEQKSKFIQKIVKGIMRYKRLMNLLIAMKMKSALIKHVVNHCLYIIGKKKPYDVAHWLLEMNKENLHSDKITQDVLLLAGEGDVFQPSILLKKQKEALINAHSVKTRVFTKKEGGENHCQIGNIRIAFDEMAKWLDEI